MYRKKRFILPLIIICILSLFLFLGETDFNTRGEPREALVALSMLQDGNWVLPINSGVDMAYKPPFFHWAIATVSTVVGEINEYTSRMPSALALTAMILMGYFFYSKRRGREVAFMAALITLTNFEVHRAGVNCRVDMVLTAFMVIALFLLYKWIERDLKGIPVFAILCLSGAALSKGPVGIVLPCLVPAVFLLIRGERFFRIFWHFLMVAVLSCVLPLLWYWAAYRQGGDAFLQLVLEENVWRFMGKMTYASHENPAYYNVIMLLAGFLPYTLLFVFSLFALTYRKLTWTPRMWWQRFVVYIRTMDDARLYSLLSIVIIFVFYCIPKSKRSVYLLPVYPFIAYFLAEYLIYLRNRHLNTVRLFGTLMAILSVVLVILFAGIRTGYIRPDMLSSAGVFIQALADRQLTVGAVILILIPLYAVYRYFRVQKLNAADNGILYAMFGVIITVYMALDGFYQPTILNTKSDKPIAEHIRTIVPEGRFYSYRSDVVENNRMHPFTVNFYLGDRIVPFDCFLPTEGYVLMGEEEVDTFRTRYPDYELTDVYNTAHKSCDDHRINHLYYFKKTVAGEVR